MDIKFFLMTLTICILGLHHLGAESPAAAMQALASAAAPSGVLFYSKDKMARAEIIAAINDNTLIGWAPQIADFETPPTNMPKPNLSKHQEDAWAFYYKGSLIASGNDAPTPEELEEAFLKAGAPNRVHTLKEFALQYPNTLGARLELMKELFAQASQKTAQALNLPQNDLAAADSAPTATEELNEDDDENIWGDFADLFDASFGYRNWLSVLPGLFGGLPESVAIHSPIMKALYKKNITMVERALENRQGDIDLWMMWLEMAQATGKRPLYFLSQLPAAPIGSKFLWSPPQAANYMKEAAWPKSDWSKAVELDWPKWPSVQLLLNIVAPYGKMPEIWHGDTALRDFFWERSILPLMEACLYNKDFNKVAGIYHDMAQRPAMERETKLAFEVAKAHGYTFPQTIGGEAENAQAPKNSNSLDARLKELAKWKWFTLVAIDSPMAGRSSGIPTTLLQRVSRSGVSIGRPQLYAPRPRIPVSPPAQMSLQDYLQAALSMDELLEHDILPQIMQNDGPIAKELIRQNNGQIPNPILWGILDEGGKYYRGGTQAPGPDQILEVINSINKETRIGVLRKYAANSHAPLTPKSILLEELQRMAVILTNNANKDQYGLLDEGDDSEIWGEFVRQADALMPELLERPDGLFARAPFMLPEIKHSKLLQQFAAKHILYIEYALQARPHSMGLWELWGALAPYVPDRALAQILGTLSPVPGVPDFPPEFLYLDLIKGYQSMSDWAKVIALLEPIWESLQRGGNEGWNTGQISEKRFMEQYMNILCNAYEKTGQDQKAAKIRAEMK
jgi:hypothetical protein